MSSAKAPNRKPKASDLELEASCLAHISRATGTVAPRRSAPTGRRDAPPLGTALSEVPPDALGLRSDALRHRWPEVDIATKHPARSQGRRPPGESQTAPRAGFWAKLGASLGCHAKVAAINRAELRSRSPSRGPAFARSVRCGKSAQGQLCLRFKPKRYRVEFLGSFLPRRAHQSLIRL